jgi:hypothetical protein
VPNLCLVRPPCCNLVGFLLVRFYRKQLDILTDLQDRTDVIPVTYTTRQVALSDTSMIIAYDTVDKKDIFTPANIQRMCLVESKWFGAANYVDFCVVKDGT